MNSKSFLGITGALVTVGGLVLTGCSSSSTPAAAGATSAAAGATSAAGAPSSAPAPGAPASSPPSSAPATTVPASASAVASTGVLASAPSSIAPAPADLKAATTRLGKVIVDAKGLTVYYFTPDVPNSGKSSCKGGCLTAWPAVVPSSGQPTGDGVTGKLGVITRDDGSKQVTVDGRPVYTFAKDSGPGEVKGQGVGKVWFAVSPGGAQIGGAQATTTTPAEKADLKTGKTKLGTVVVDAKGLSVYYFTHDVANSGKSTCSGGCAKAWPPVIPSASAPAGTGITGELGVITRADGRKQVTVAGRPIYTFAGDKVPGDTNGQDDNEAWYVLSPGGQQIGS